MFYDEQGKHVRTKKEILDENGDIRKGCKIVKKGEVYEHNLFTAKNKLFKQDNFVDEVKHFYIEPINILIKGDKEKLHVFDENGLYLASKKIGKNNPTEKERDALDVPNGSVFSRPSARAIIIKDGKIAIVYSKKYNRYRQLAIHVNREIILDAFTQVILEQEALVLELLIQEGYFEYGGKLYENTQNDIV